MKACFMGLGYIGLPTAIIAAGSGIQVIGVDVNPKVVEMTNRGVIHIVEPGLQELCSKVMEFGKLKASDVPEESDVYLIVVPTPFKGNHEPDISYVEAATRMVAPFLKKGDLFFTCRDHRKDGKSALRFASGTGRKNIYRLLSGARFTRQCHLRTDAERPGHRRNQLRIN